MTERFITAADRIVDDSPQSTGETFTRNQQLTLLGIALIAYGLTAVVGREVGFFTEPDFGASLLLDPSAATAMLKTIVWTIVVGVGATYLGRKIRPDVGLFAASIALLAIRRVGGTTRDVYLQHSSAGAIRAMALELLLLGITLGVVFAVARMLIARGIIADDFAHDSILPKPEPLGQKLIAVGVTALTVGMAVLILCRSDERMQVTVALLIGGIVSAWSAVRFIPATPSGWFWAGPIVIGIVGYVTASLSPGATLSIGEPSGYAPALARALPLDYASAGVAGAIYGYWIGRKHIPEESLAG